MFGEHNTCNIYEDNIFLYYDLLGHNVFYDVRTSSYTPFGLVGGLVGVVVSVHYIVWRVVHRCAPLMIHFYIIIIIICNILARHLSMPTPLVRHVQL